MLELVRQLVRDNNGSPVLLTVGVLSGSPLAPSQFQGAVEVHEVVPATELIVVSNSDGTHPIYINPSHVIWIQEG